MVSAFTHAVSALALRTPFRPDSLPRGAALAGIVGSILPDADVIGFRFGVRYGDLLGHRGITHSIAFALVVAGSSTALWARLSKRPFSRRALALYLFLCVGSHGLLDALTDGGLGIAFFAPFDPTRYFLPWTPVAVSPIGIENFFNAYGFEVLKTEVVWVWVPCALLACAALAWRRATARAQVPEG